MSESKPTTEKKEPTSEKREKMLTIIIDHDETDGGVMVNGKLYVGEVTVPEEQAKDLLRIIREYKETKTRMNDAKAFVRQKNDFVNERLYLADPRENRGKKGWTDEFGLLDPRQWEFISEQFKEELKSKRKAMFGI